MATRRFAELAVYSLHAYLESNFETYLRAVETELGLSSGDLPDPADYVPADLPFDNRNPRLDVFDESWDLDDDGDDVFPSVSCTIAWSYLGDAEPEAAELIARRSLTALLKCLYADRSLGGAVKECQLAGGSTTAVPEEGGARHVWVQDVVVLLHEVL